MSNLKHEFGHSTGHIKHQLSEALKKDTSLPALQKWLPLYIRQETNYEEKKETVLAVIDALAKKPEDGKAEALVLIKYSLGHDKEQKFEAYVKDNHIKIPDIYPDRAKKEFEVYTAVQATPDDQLDLDLARKVAELLPQVPEKELRRTETKELVEKLAITARYMPVMKNFLFNEWPKAVANLPSAATRVQLFTGLLKLMRSILKKQLSMILHSGKL